MSIPSNLSLESIESLAKRLLQEERKNMKILIDESVKHKAIPLKQGIANQHEKQKRINEDLDIRLNKLETNIMTTPPALNLHEHHHTNEIVIGVTKEKSKQGAIAMCQNLFCDAAGSPEILHDGIANVSSVVVIKFDTHDHAHNWVN